MAEPPECVVAPVEFERDGKHGRLKFGDLAEAVVGPIIGDMGDEANARMILPQGFIWQDSEIVNTDRGRAHSQHIHMEAMPGMIMLGPWSAADAIAMFVMWAAMMVAMMLPSVAPMALLYARTLRFRAGQGRGQATPRPPSWRATCSPGPAFRYSPRSPTGPCIRAASWMP